MEFYICPEINCNRKYKTKNKLIAHVLTTHNTLLTDDEISDPIKISKENKNSVMKQINTKKTKEELMKKALLQKQAKEEALKEFKESEKQRFLDIETQGLQVLEKQKRLDIQRLENEQKLLGK